MSDEPLTTHRVVTGPEGRPVLVKRATTEAGAARLAGEGAVIRALAHPGVVQVVHHTDGELHLAWVGPHSLATVAGMPVASAGAVVGQVAAIAADLHRAGIGHGRLTADHVLLAGDGRVVLTGLADAGRVDRVPAEEDVRALGALLTSLVAPHEDQMVPDHRRSLSARGGDGGRRATLLTLADRATADDPAARPSAADLAVELTLLCAPPAARRRHRRPRRSSGPAGDRAPSSTVPLPAATAAAGPTRPAPSDLGTAPLEPPHPTAPVPTVDPPAPMAPAAPSPSPVGVDAGFLDPQLGWSRPAGPDPAASPTRATPRPAPAPRPEPARPVDVGRRPASTRVPRGRALAAAALAVSVGLTIAAALWIAPSAAEPGGDVVAPTTSTVPPPTTTEATTTTGTPSADSPAPTAPPRCAAVSAPSPADVDGDGCAEAVTVTGERVTVGPVTWVVGRPDDVVVVGDWDCDGTATAASLRPATGEVFVFDRWPDGDESLTIDAVATVADARTLRRDGPADECPALLAQRGDGSTEEVTTR